MNKALRKAVIAGNWKMNCPWNGICSALCRMKCRPPSDKIGRAHV